MSQCNQCCRTPCECMDGDETERAVTTNTDPEAIAREVERLVGEALEAERIRCTRQADRDAARRDAAYLDLRAQLDAVRAKLVESETWRTELRQEMDAAKGQLRDVKAQRDELREAAQSYSDMHGMCDGMEPCKSYMSGHRDACETEARLLKALETAR